MALIPRGIESELRDILSVSRAAAITGPRQVGKSTLAKQLQGEGVVPNYFSLDDEATRTAARADPDGFALSLPRPAVIDEVQLIGVDASRYAAPDQGPVAGMLFETFVLMELVKQATWSTAPVELFFYRDAEKREVDFVIESSSGEVVGIEVKSAATVGAADANGLRLLRDKLGTRFKTGMVIYSGEHTLPVEDRIWAVPISGLWQ